MTGPQVRPHALAEFEVAIAKAEADRDRHRQRAERLTGEAARRARVYLRLAEAHLAKLYRSRDVLISGEEHQGVPEAHDVHPGNS